MTHLPPSPLLRQLATEADSIGVAVSVLLMANLTRYRDLAAAAVPALTEWDWGFLGHVLSGLEAASIVSGDDALPGPQRIAAEIESWIDSASYDDALRAGDLRQRVITWSHLTIAGVLMRLREDCVRSHYAALRRFRLRCGAGGSSPRSCIAP